MKKKSLIIVGSVVTLAAVAGLSAFTYLTVLPAVVSNQKLINFVEKNVNKIAKINVNIENPVLQTSLSPVIVFKVAKIDVSKGGEQLLSVENLDTKFSFNEILKKRIIVNKLALDYVYADVNKLMSLMPQQEKKKEKTESEWDIDLFDSVLALKKSVILYKLEPDIYVKVQADKMLIDNTQKKEKHLRFVINTDVKKADKILHFAIADKDRVFIKDKAIHVDDCVLDINNSNVHIDALASRKDGLNVSLWSKKFKIKDVTDIVGSNILINNGSEVLSFFKDMDGTFNFDINLKRKNLTGKVTLNDLKLKLVPVNNLPLYFNKGTALITNNDITFKDIEGYHGNRKINNVKINGLIKDYTKSCDTEVTIDTVAMNDFAKDYLSKLVGIPMEIIGKAGTRIVVKSIYNKIDVTVMSKLAKGHDILVDGASLTPTGYDRAVKADMHFENNILDLKSVDYYIASELKKGVKVKPVLSLRGRLDCSKPVPFVNAIGFTIPNPLPSEFLNVLIGQRILKGGKFYGDLYMVNNGTYPKVWGRMYASDIRIPSQRVTLKSGELITDRETVNVKAKGRYKRSQFDFSGNIKNAIMFPIVVNNVDFSLDKIDIERVMQSFNQQNTAAVPSKPQEVADSDYVEGADDDAVVFDVNNIIIKRCILRLKEGKYKDINFGNIAANLTLNENNILELHSNRFDIAEGISSVKVRCDLKKHLYNITLGIKDVNSDTMSTALLNLPREISGKASGIIDLNTDDSLKLNGIIKFVVNNGTIQKVGLVEYVLKFAALFRNPIAMISPSTISDMVNIPEGNFDKITGDMVLKDNVVEMLKIKSSAPQLSSFIVGRYNLENGDAILRIYTKFSNKNKGFAGFLRNFSLNSLANRIPLSSRSDAQYYAAELEQLPPLDADEKDCQIFLTKVDGDVQHNNFLSSLKKLK